MTAVAWLALAGAVLLVPAASPLAGRVAVLAAAGRLAAVPARSRSRERRRRAVVPVALVAGAAVGLGLGPALGVAAVVAALTVRSLVRGSGRRRRAAHRRRGLVAAVRLLAAELAAGARPGDALAAAARAAPDHRAVWEAAAMAAQQGGDVAPVLLGVPDVAGVGQVWRVAEASGAPLADVLERLAADLAAAQSQQRAVATALAGPRSTAVLLAALPVVGLSLGAAMGTNPVAFLFGSHVGRLLCCAGVVFDAAGVVWVEGLLRRVEEP